MSVGMPRRRPELILWLILLLVSPCLRAQDRPLQTPEAETVPAGVLRAQMGFDFLQDVSYPASGLSGDLTSVGVLNLRMGVGRIVEIQLQGAVQNFLDVRKQVATLTPIVLTLTGSNSTHDVGGFSMYTKIRLWSESGRHPAAAFRFGYLIPNTNQARGIGLNTTDIFASFILQKHFGKLNTFGTLGVGILQAPNGLYAQNDVLTYGGAFIYPLHRRVNLAGEVFGRYSTRKINTPLIGTESASQVRVGFQIFAGGFQWDVAGLAGLARHDATSGFTFGLSRDIRIFSFDHK